MWPKLATPTESKSAPAHSLSRKTDLARRGVGADDFLAVMGAAVDFEDVVVKIFHAQAQARDAHLADRLEFVAGQRARLALERDFLGLVPRQHGLHAVGQMTEL